MSKSYPDGPQWALSVPFRPPIVSDLIRLKGPISEREAIVQRVKQVFNAIAHRPNFGFVSGIVFCVYSSRGCPFARVGVNNPCFFNPLIRVIRPFTRFTGCQSAPI
jgi:hypothetical protein